MAYTDVYPNLVREDLIGFTKMLINNTYSAKQLQGMLSDEDYLFAVNELYSALTGKYSYNPLSEFIRGTLTKSEAATISSAMGDRILAQKIVDYVKPKCPVNGAHLIDMGYTPGPNISVMLEQIQFSYNIYCSWGYTSDKDQEYFKESTLEVCREMLLKSQALEFKKLALEYKILVYSISECNIINH